MYFLNIYKLIQKHISFLVQSDEFDTITTISLFCGVPYKTSCSFVAFFATHSIEILSSHLQQMFFKLFELIDIIAFVQ